MKKIMWLMVSCLMILSLVLASCAPKVTEEEEVVTPPTEKEKEAVVTPPTEKEKEVVPIGPEMVKLSLKKLDGTVVEKMVEKPRYGGTMTTLTATDPPGFDPNNSMSDTAYFVQPAYEKLQGGDFSRGPVGTNEYDFTHYFYVPIQFRVGSLAESWEMPDPLTVIWHIRKGIHFQNVPPVNGRELTAGDVVYSILRQKAAPTMSPAFWGMVDTVEAADKYTVVEKLNRIEYLHVDETGDGSRSAVYARECVEKYGNLNDWKSLVGTGPWIITDYIRGSVATYKKNPDYWMKDPLFPENNLPYADNMKILIIPDMSTQMSALRTGKVDVLFTPSIIGMYTWTEAESIAKSNPEIKQDSTLSTAAYLGMRARVDEPPFNNILVRQAVALAIDYQEILDNYLKGQGVLHSHPMMESWGEELWTPVEKLPTEPTIPGSRCSVRELYDGDNPEKAKQLLAEAGYPNGFTADIYCAAAQVDQASLLKAYLQEIGINLKIEVKDAVVFAKMKAALPRTYHGVMYYSTQSPGPWGIWSSEYITLGSRNVGNLSDSYIDQTYLDMHAEPDLAKRNKMAKALALYIFEQAYALDGPHTFVYNFWQPWLKNCEGTQYLSPWGMLQGLAYFWVDQNLKEEMTGRR